MGIEYESCNGTYSSKNVHTVYISQSLGKRGLPSQNMAFTKLPISWLLGIEKNYTSINQPGDYWQKIVIISSVIPEVFCFL